MDRHGVPAHELSDAELERQGTQAHAKRNSVFLHGTAEQFRHHTERMLELEQEYLRRHPKRTWQGAHPDTTDDGSGYQLSEVDRWTRVRQAFRLFTDQMNALLDEVSTEAAPRAPEDVDARLLARFAEAPDGRMHKLEAHQVARELGSDPARVAALYKHDPPLLATAGSERYITEAGRSWLAEHGDDRDNSGGEGRRREGR